MSPEGPSISPFLKGVNWNPGRYRRSLALLAVFLNCPSDLVVSNWGGKD